MADAISIEETNKVRLALGLPALPVPGGGPTFKASKDDASSSEEDVGSTLESRQAQGYDNWKKLQEEQDAKGSEKPRMRPLRKLGIPRAKMQSYPAKALEKSTTSSMLTREHG